MAYLDRKRMSTSPQAVIAVVTVHALLGYAVVNGLATEIAKLGEPPRIEGGQIPIDPPPPPPPPTAEPKADPRPTASDTVIAPPKPIDLSINNPPIGEIKLPPLDFGPIVRPTGEGGLGSGLKPVPTPTPRFDPVAARPANDPGAWVTTGDYRAAWVNRGYAGTARFEVTVGASGRVESCRITSSTGHDELDQATCALVTRRARFDAARDGNGDKTAGTYRSAVKWDLPD